jgi:hypothetical protein
MAHLDDFIEQEAYLMIGLPAVACFATVVRSLNLKSPGLILSSGHLITQDLRIQRNHLSIPQPVSSPAANLMLSILMATKENVQATFPEGLTPDDEAFLRQFLLYANSDRDNSSDQATVALQQAEPLASVLKSVEGEGISSCLSGLSSSSSSSLSSSSSSSLLSAASSDSLSVLGVQPGDVPSPDPSGASAPMQAGVLEQEQRRLESLKRLVASPLLGLSISLSQTRLFKDNFRMQVILPCIGSKSESDLLVDSESAASVNGGAGDIASKEPECKQPDA